MIITITIIIIITSRWAPGEEQVGEDGAEQAPLHDRDEALLDGADLGRARVCLCACVCARMYMYIMYNMYIMYIYIYICVFANTSIYVYIHEYIYPCTIEGGPIEQTSKQCHGRIDISR